MSFTLGFSDWQAVRSNVQCSQQQMKANPQHFKSLQALKNHRGLPSYISNFCFVDMYVLVKKPRKILKYFFGLFLIETWEVSKTIMMNLVKTLRVKAKCVQLKSKSRAYKVHRQSQEGDFNYQEQLICVNDTSPGAVRSVLRSMNKLFDYGKVIQPFKFPF